MANIVIILILVLIVGYACFYIYKSKKKGVKCIGCSSAGSCSGGCSCSETKDIKK